MKKIIISDLTLREEVRRTDLSLSFKEKLEFARELDRLGVDVIETAPLTGKKADTLLIRTLAALLKNTTLSCPVGRDVSSVEETWAAIKDAAKPRLLISLPVSTVQMEYVIHKKPNAMSDYVSELVSAAKAYCQDVEFSAEDASRADPEFLCQIIEAAVNAGANIITICDTAGKMLPGELASLIAELYEKLPSLKDITLSVQCSDDMDMATSCTFTAINSGASQIKVSSTHGSNPTLGNIAHVFHHRGDSIGICCGIDMTGIHRVLKRMSWLKVKEPVSNNISSASGDIAASGEDFVIDPSADRATVDSFIGKLGYTLSEDDLAKVYDEFVRVAANKPIGAAELDTIVASAALQVPPTYELQSYVINSGNVISATANINLVRDGNVITGLSMGDGPIDASFKAIEQILGHHYELDDFQIASVTEGREAIGKALVKLRSDGMLFSGQGISTDIICASIRAYVDAVNKIVYEENMI